MRHSKKLAVFILTLTCALYSLVALAHSSIREQKLGHKTLADHSPAAIAGLSKADQSTRSQVSEAYGKLPLSFEINRGQVANPVKFLSRGSGYTLLLTPTGAIISLPKNQPEGTDPLTRDGLSQTDAEASATTFGMSLVGANSHPRINGLDELPGKSNYLMGSDASQCFTNIANFARVKYGQVYPGIDMIYYGNQGQLEYDFILAPHADPGRIRLSYEGVDRLEIDESGNLVLDIAGQAIRQHKPLIYQEVNGQRHEVAGGYFIMKGQRVGFRVGAFDHSKPLLIDPTIAYSTGIAGGSAQGIAVDSSGCAYVTGYAQPTTAFVATEGPLPATTIDSRYKYMFVAKLNPAGNALVYSTILAGRGGHAKSVAVDAAGNAYITGAIGGDVGGDFPLVNSWRTFPLINSAAILTKISADGTQLLFSTLIGHFAFGADVAVDNSGNAYVAGQIAGQLETTANAYQPNYGGGAYDAFLAKVNTNLSGISALTYCTYLGGPGADGSDVNADGTSVAVDNSGNAFIAGDTVSGGFPTRNAAQPTSGGNLDGFVARLNTNLSGDASLIYSTYLGGLSNDVARGIAIDAAHNAYVTGYTSSTNFPVKNPAQATNKGSSDAFITKLDPSGALVYSTYLGSPGTENSQDIAVDPAGNACITGQTDSPAFGPPLPSDGYFGIKNMFVAKLSASGSSVIYANYIATYSVGLVAYDVGLSIATDPSGCIYIAGDTSASGYPKVNPLPYNVGSFGSAVATKICSGDTVTPPTCGSPITAGLNARWPGDGNANDVAGQNNGTATPTVTYEAAEVAQGFRFNASDTATSVVRVPNTPSLQPAALTVEAWVKATAAPGAYKYIVSKSDDNCSSSYGLYSHGGGLAFYVKTGAGCYGNVQFSPDPGPGIWDGSFHHVVGTYDGSFVRLYVDGAQIGNGSALSSPIQYDSTFQNGDLLIGNFVTDPGTSYAWPGVIDDVKIYHRALSADEIVCNSTPPSTASCVTSRWLAEGNAADVAGTNTGTLKNGAAFAAGYTGQGFSLDGNNAYVEVPMSTPEFNSPASFTWEAWINPTSLANNPVVFSKESDVYNRAGLQILADGSLCSYMNSGGCAAVSAPGVISACAFNKVTLLYDGSTHQLITYVNGSQVSSATVATPYDNAAPFNIGWSPFGFGNTHFPGRIDEVSFSSCAMPPSASQSVASGCGTTPPSSSCSGNPGGVFVTGHDPDYTAAAGGNFAGGQHLIQKSIAYVTHGKANPRILLVMDMQPPAGTNSDSRLAMVASGFGTFDVADYGSGQGGALDLHTVNFGNYDVIVVASDYGGWLKQAELDVLNARQSDIVSFVNGGGGLVAFAESGRNDGGVPSTTHGRFDFVPFPVHAQSRVEFESGNTLTAAGLALGLTNADINNGNFLFNFFNSDSGMDVIDRDPSGGIISLATQRCITPTPCIGGSILLDDNFDSENGGVGAGVYTGFANWDVTKGSIDLLGPNGFLTNTGLYVDLDGTGGGSAGTLVTRKSFTLNPGTYQLQFDLAGNSRNNDPDTVNVSLGNVYFESFTLNGTAPVRTIIRTINVTTATTGRLVFEHLGYDFVGLLLDNVKLQTLTCGGSGTPPRCSATVTVPGTSNPWLAGMPAGSTDAGNDAAPQQSPALVTGVSVTGGAQLSFSATGAVGFCNCGVDGPDGSAGSGGHSGGSDGSVNGIGQIVTTWNSLVGVFLDDSQPDSSPAPTNVLNFSTLASRDYLTLSPALKQPFFIGDGQTSAGATQTIIAPAGATRLFLGTMDGFGWFNNVGSFTVTVTGGCLATPPTPSTPPPSIGGGLPPDGGIMGPHGGYTPVAPGRYHTTLTGTGHPGCSIQVTVNDPARPVNNITLTTPVDASGNWSLGLDLYDCDPEIDIVQLCDGVASDPVRRHIYVDGTPPVFTNGGPGDGTDYTGSGGTARIVLDGGASDPGDAIHLPPGDGVTYEWHLFGPGGGDILLGGGGGSYWSFTGGGGILTINLPPGDYFIEEHVCDTAGNCFVKRCHHRVCAHLTVTGGLPGDEGIYGPGDGVTIGKVTRVVTGTGNPGCSVQVAVTDPTHPQLVDNNKSYTVPVDTSGNWSLPLTLDDCDPVVTITQICDGVSDGGDIIRRHVYVDGTPPTVGLGDGDIYVGTNGTGGIVLDAGAGDAGSHVSNDGLSYSWYIIPDGGNGVPRLLCDGCPGVYTDNEPAGDYTYQVVVTDRAGNQTTKRCHRRVLKRPTAITYTGDVMIANGGVAVLQGVLTDITPPLGATPVPVVGRSVTLTLGSGPGAQSCTGVTDATGFVRCTINPVNQPLGPGGVATDVFAGDDVYLPSNNGAQTLIFAFPSATGNFVIGDLNAQVGNQVTFWGAQWETLNSMSGGPSNNGFKGWENQNSANPPRCGGTWTTDPGNSSGPPSTIPSYMGVIVSSAISKSGSNITGNIRKIVIVRTNAGYDSNAGHAGTGTVVAVFCQ